MLEYLKRREARMRETHKLPEGLHSVGIVQSGAIIVFDDQNRRTASYVPGVLWVGSLELPESYSLDVLEQTQLVTPEKLSLEQIVTASQRLALWSATTNSNNSYTRILTALDALGEFTGYQQELAHVCCMSREYLLRYLRDLVIDGRIIRSSSRTMARASTISLPANERGRHWRHTPRRLEAFERLASRIGGAGSALA